MEEMKVGQGNQSVVPYNVPLITLSDSDSGNSISILVETQNTARKKRKKKYKKKKNSTEPKAKRIQMDMPLLPGKNFIPVNVEKGKITASTTNEADVSVSTSEDNIVVIEETIPRPIPENPRHLRPIVIDGSNVAIAHGECTNTYSSKGIQIAIDYFLKKGHTQVTAFVPLFRKSRNNGNFRTTGIKILKKLSKTQHVVFTPSWRRGNKLKMCYDDRFIVRLASITDGVVVSNDNYNDLIHVDEFRKTIKERLLKFCFVGDIFMVPDDPLGRHGPSLDDYLSFPAT